MTYIVGIIGLIVGGTAGSATTYRIMIRSHSQRQIGGDGAVQNQAGSGSISNQAGRDIGH